MKCLVTGANGFLGTNLVRELVDEGWQVRASGRQPALTRWLADLPVDYAQADITNADAVSAAIAGCDVVFHVAGDTSFWKPLYPRQRATNVDGTANVARACLDHGVKRMVHTSTADVFGYDPDGGMVDESHGFNYTGMDYHYGETKLEADRQLRTVMDDGLEAVLLHPGSIIGPWDHTLQFGRLFFELKEGKVPAAPPGGASFCHAREVARAHIRAAEQGTPGESYLLAGASHSNVPHARLMAMMAEAVAARPPRWILPEWLFVTYAWGFEQVARVTGKPPQINPGQARYMSRPQFCDSSKAQAALDYRVPSLSTCIEDALAWYRANGFAI